MAVPSFVTLVFALLLLPHNAVCFVPKNIILLSGQSNMGGKGGIVKNVWDKYVPPKCFPSPNIFRLSKQLVWEEATEPLHRDVDNLYKNVDGIGPGMPFSTILLKKKSSFGAIGLVPAALSGSKITQWHRTGVVYNRFMTRAKAGMVEAGGRNNIKAMLWYQGESDTATLEDAVMYKTKVEQFFTNVRSDLQLPFLPIIHVALASGLNATNLDIVRKAQLELELPHVSCVDAMGLQLQTDDPIHLTLAAQLRLGEMLAYAFLEIVR